jgi:hypothetical protein
VAKLTPCKKKLFDRIQTRESAPCKLRKKYMTKNVREVCQFNGNPLIQALSSSLNVQTSLFWHPLLGTVAMKPEGRRCGFKDSVGCLLPETCPEIPYISPFTISPTFHSKHFV